MPSFSGRAVINLENETEYEKLKKLYGWRVTLMASWSYNGELVDVEVEAHTRREAEGGGETQHASVVVHASFAGQYRPLHGDLGLCIARQRSQLEVFRRLHVFFDEPVIRAGGDEDGLVEAGAVEAGDEAAHAHFIDGRRCLGVTLGDGVADETGEDNDVGDAVEGMIKWAGVTATGFAGLFVEMPTQGRMPITAAFLTNFAVIATSTASVGIQALAASATGVWVMQSDGDFVMCQFRNGRWNFLEGAGATMHTAT